MCRNPRATALPVSGGIGPSRGGEYITGLPDGVAQRGVSVVS
jgi:hypothetical protein